MLVHDIDLTLWFFGEQTVVKSISASGIRAVHPDLAKFNDCDNAVGIVEFWGGKIAYFFCSRMMAHGQEDTTEIIGTEGKLVVNGNPQVNLVNTYTSNGIVRETPPDYWGRFELAFVTVSIIWGLIRGHGSDILTFHSGIERVYRRCAQQHAASIRTARRSSRGPDRQRLTGIFGQREEALLRRVGQANRVACFIRWGVIYGSII